MSQYFTGLSICQSVTQSVSVTYLLRNVGEQIVLGCGYRGGSERSVADRRTDRAVQFGRNEPRLCVVRGVCGLGTPR